MSTGGGETRRDPSGWTTDTLRQHMDERFDALEELFTAKLDATREEARTAQREARIAVDKAEEAMNERLRGVNEFRAQLSDQASGFVPRDVFESQHQALEDRMSIVERRQYEETGSTSGSRYVIGLFVAAGVIVISVVSVLANYLSSH